MLRQDSFRAHSPQISAWNRGTSRTCHRPSGRRKTTWILESNLDAPRWDQSTFWGRFKHFFAITDWRKALYSNSQLDKAKETVEDYRYTYVKILANKISRELFSMTVKFWMVFAQHSQKTWQFFTSNPVWLRYVFCARDWQHMTWSSNFIYRWGINYLWTQN